MTTIQAPTPQRDASTNKDTLSTSAKIDIPLEFDSAISLDFLRTGSTPTPIRERATHVQALAQENQKLEQELKEMDERLKAAERRTEELKKKNPGLAA